MPAALFMVMRAKQHMLTFDRHILKRQSRREAQGQHSCRERPALLFFPRVNECVNISEEPLGNSFPNIKLWCHHGKSHELQQSFQGLILSLPMASFLSPSISQYLSAAELTWCKGFLQHPFCCPKQELQSMSGMELQAAIAEKILYSVLPLVTC